MIKTFFNLDSAGGDYIINVEIYTSCNDLVRDLKTRNITNKKFHDVKNEKMDSSWSGVESYEEAIMLLDEGYEPATLRLYEELVIKKGGRVSGLNKDSIFSTSVVGFQPIVPLVLNGVPNNMLIRKREKTSARVINVFMDNTCINTVTIDGLINTGIQLLKMIYNLEMCGHKVNLYMIEGFAGRASADLLILKIKDSDSPLDLKRISFPMCHTAFTRVVGFDWYSKFPKGVFRKGYGTTLDSALSLDERNAFLGRVFGPGSKYISYKDLEDKGETYLRQVINIEEVSVI